MGQSRGIGAVITAGVLALTLPAAFVAVLASRGVPLLGGEAQAAAVASEAPQLPPALAVLAQSPAVSSMSTALTAGPGAPWLPASETTWAVGTPYDYACALVPWKGPGAAVSAQRTFADGARSVTVTLHSYGAGAGALAFDTLRERLDTCPQRDAAVATAFSTVGGRQAIVGTVRPTGFPKPVNAVAWRQGDVLVEVHSSDLPPADMDAVTNSIDGSVVSALMSTCANRDSTTDDALRSPWLTRTGFRGLLAPEQVTATARPLPSPPPGVVVRELDAVVDPLPTPTLPSVTPSEPVWPPLPTPVPTPVAPTPVGPQPTSLAVGVPVRDEVGPGCGWAFTGQSPPVFDEVQAASQREALLADASTRLQTAQDAWQAAVIEYWRQFAAYDSGLGAFRLYVAQLGQVALAWTGLQMARDAYAVALAEWQAVVSQRTALLTAQQAAAREYQAALDRCAAATAAPSPSGSPSAAPTATASPTAAPSCPPERPAILDQPLPVIPPAPTPPPDPRPASAGGRATPSPTSSR